MAIGKLECVGAHSRGEYSIFKNTAAHLLAMHNSKTKAPALNWKIIRIQQETELCIIYVSSRQTSYDIQLTIDY